MVLKLRGVYYPNGSLEMYKVCVLFSSSTVLCTLESQYYLHIIRHATGINQVLIIYVPIYFDIMLSKVVDILCLFCLLLCLFCLLCLLRLLFFLLLLLLLFLFTSPSSQKAMKLVRSISICCPALKNLDVRRIEEQKNRRIEE